MNEISEYIEFEKEMMANHGKYNAAIDDSSAGNAIRVFAKCAMVFFYSFVCAVLFCENNVKLSNFSSIFSFTGIILILFPSNVWSVWEGKGRKSILEKYTFMPVDTRKMFLAKCIILFKRNLCYIIIPQLATLVARYFECGRVMSSFMTKSLFFPTYIGIAGMVIGFIYSYLTNREYLQ